MTDVERLAPTGHGHPLGEPALPRGRGATAVARQSSPRGRAGSARPRPGCAGRGDAEPRRPTDRSPSDGDAVRERAPSLSAPGHDDAARTPRRRLVSVVDDDESMREALESLLKSAGFDAEVFASAEELLRSESLPQVDCLIVDVRMPGMTGLELQRHLVAAGSSIPIIFVTAHGDEQSKTRALEAGAVAFLRKPFSEEALLNALHRAL